MGVPPVAPPELPLVQPPFPLEQPGGNVAPAHQAERGDHSLGDPTIAPLNTSVSVHGRDHMEGLLVEFPHDPCGIRGDDRGCDDGGSGIPLGQRGPGRDEVEGGEVLVGALPDDSHCGDVGQGDEAGFPALCDGGEGLTSPLGPVDELPSTTVPDNICDSAPCIGEPQSTTTSLASSKPP